MALNRMEGGHRIAAGPAFREGLLLRESFLAVVTFSKNINAHAGDIFQLEAQIFPSYQP